MGFAATASTHADRCKAGDPGDAWEISNAPTGDPDAFNRVQKERGTVFCSLYKHAVFDAKLDSDLHEGANSPIFHGRKARFWFKNVECLLYAGDAKQDQQVHNLWLAMTRLSR